MTATLEQTVKKWAWNASPEDAAREIMKTESLEPEEVYQEMKRQGYKKKDIGQVKVWVAKMQGSPLLIIDPWEMIDPDDFKW